MADRALARSASTARLRGSALVTSESIKWRAASVTSSIASLNAASFARAFGDRVTRFRELQRRMDPDRLFANDQARRLGLI